MSDFRVAAAGIDDEWIGLRAGREREFDWLGNWRWEAGRALATAALLLGGNGFGDLGGEWNGKRRRRNAGWH